MTKLIVGNWKMYPTLADSIVLASAIKTGLEDIKGVEVVVAPPTSWITAVKEEWRHKLTHLHLGSQNAWAEDQGAYTGEVSAYFLKDLVSYAILGHSERRKYAKEDNELISQKIHACLKWQITPIVCIGEEKKVIDEHGGVDENQWNHLSEQLLEALEGIGEQRIDKIIIAYEPVWAIGSNNPAKPEYALAIIEKLRKKVEDKHGIKVARGLKFLYGGSVNATNASDYLRFPDIAGFLVGSASVKANEFIDICRQAASIAD